MSVCLLIESILWNNINMIPDPTLRLRHIPLCLLCYLSASSILTLTNIKQGCVFLYPFQKNHLTIVVGTKSKLNAAIHQCCARIDITTIKLVPCIWFESCQAK
jgi:hypothetical protein